MHLDGSSPELAGEVWRRALSEIPSTFGRLVYMTSLRDPNFGQYIHYGFALTFGHEETDATISRAHEEAFAQWLSYDLNQEKADLDVYLSELGVPRRALIDAWRLQAPYENLIPASAAKPERDLYIAELRTILELLHNELPAGPTTPAAPKRQYAVGLKLVEATA